jgi:hypothetical protein
MEVPATNYTTGKFIAYAARGAASYTVNGTEGSDLIIMDEQWVPVLGARAACSVYRLCVVVRLCGAVHVPITLLVCVCVCVCVCVYVCVLYTLLSLVLHWVGRTAASKRCPCPSARGFLGSCPSSN